MQKMHFEGVPSIKQVYLPIENHPRRGVLRTPAGERSSPLRQKGQRISRSLSFFTRLDLQGIECYTL